MARPLPGDDPQFKKRAPTLYFIIGVKLLKFAAFTVLACVLYALSDNDLPAEYHRALHILRLNPERQFWVDLAKKVGTLTQANLLWTAVGTVIYSLFSLVEAVGLMFRVSWAGWLAIGESAFFIPIEVFELVRHPFSWGVLLILGLNIFIVAYLLQNRRLLFHHHAHRHSP